MARIIKLQNAALPIPNPNRKFLYGGDSQTGFFKYNLKDGQELPEGIKEGSYLSPTDYSKHLALFDIDLGNLDEAGTKAAESAFNVWSKAKPAKPAAVGVVSSSNLTGLNPHTVGTSRDGLATATGTGTTAAPTAGAVSGTSVILSTPTNTTQAAAPTQPKSDTTGANAATLSTPLTTQAASPAASTGSYTYQQGIGATVASPLNTVEATPEYKKVKIAGTELDWSPETRQEVARQLYLQGKTGAGVDYILNLIDNGNITELTSGGGAVGTDLGNLDMSTGFAHRTGIGSGKRKSALLNQYALYDVNRILHNIAFNKINEDKIKAENAKLDFNSEGTAENIFFPGVKADQVEWRTTEDSLLGGENPRGQQALQYIRDSIGNHVNKILNHQYDDTKYRYQPNYTKEQHEHLLNFYKQQGWTQGADGTWRSNYNIDSNGNNMLDDQDLINLAQYSGIDLNGWFKNRQDSMIEREKAARDSVIADNQSASAAKLAAMADQVTMAEYEQKLEQMILNGEVTREQANAAIAEARKAAKIANGETPDPAAGDGNNDGTSGNTGDTLTPVSTEGMAEITNPASLEAAGERFTAWDPKANDKTGSNKSHKIVEGTGRSEFLQLTGDKTGTPDATYDLGDNFDYEFYDDNGAIVNQEQFKPSEVKMFWAKKYKGKDLPPVYVLVVSMYSKSGGTTLRVFDEKTARQIMNGEPARMHIKGRNFNLSFKFKQDRGVVQAAQLQGVPAQRRGGVIKFLLGGNTDSIKSDSIFVKPLKTDSIPPAGSDSAQAVAALQLAAATQTAATGNNSTVTKADLPGLYVRSQNLAASQAQHHLDNYNATHNSKSLAESLRAENIGDLQWEDYAELGALAADVTSLVTGLMPSVTAQGVSLGTGMASTIATSAADISRNGLTWGNAAGAVAGLGMDIASTLYKPAKVGKVGKTIARIAPWIGRVFKGIGAVNAYAVLQKGMNEGWDKVSTSEWQQLLGGILAATNTVMKRGTKWLGTVEDTPNTFSISNKKGQQLEFDTKADIDNYVAQRGSVASNKKKADALKAKQTSAKARYDADPSDVNRQALENATNAYNEAVAALETSTNALNGMGLYTGRGDFDHTAAVDTKWFSSPIGLRGFKDDAGNWQGPIHRRTGINPDIDTNRHNRLLTESEYDQSGYISKYFAKHAAALQHYPGGGMSFRGTPENYNPHTRTITGAGPLRQAEEPEVETNRTQSAEPETKTSKEIVGTEPGVKKPIKRGWSHRDGKNVFTDINGEEYVLSLRQGEGYVNDHKVKVNVSGNHLIEFDIPDGRSILIHDDGTFIVFKHGEANSKMYRSFDDLPDEVKPYIPRSSNPVLTGNGTTSSVVNTSGSEPEINTGTPHNTSPAIKPEDSLNIETKNGETFLGGKKVTAQQSDGAGTHFYLTEDGGSYRYTPDGKIQKQNGTDWVDLDPAEANRFMKGSAGTGTPEASAGTTGTETGTKSTEAPEVSTETSPAQPAAEPELQPFNNPRLKAHQNVKGSTNPTKRVKPDLSNPVYSANKKMAAGSSEVDLDLGDGSKKYKVTSVDGNTIEVEAGGKKVLIENGLTSEGKALTPEQQKAVDSAAAVFKAKQNVEQTNTAAESVNPTGGNKPEIATDINKNSKKGKRVTFKEKDTNGVTKNKQYEHTGLKKDGKHVIADTNDKNKLFVYDEKTGELRAMDTAESALYKKNPSDFFNKTKASVEAEKVKQTAEASQPEAPKAEPEVKPAETKPVENPAERSKTKVENSTINNGAEAPKGVEKFTTRNAEYDIETKQDGTYVNGKKLENAEILLSSIFYTTKEGHIVTIWNDGEFTIKKPNEDHSTTYPSFEGLPDDLKAILPKPKPKSLKSGGRIPKYKDGTAVQVNGRDSSTAGNIWDKVTGERLLNNAGLAGSIITNNRLLNKAKELKAPPGGITPNITQMDNIGMGSQMAQMSNIAQSVNSLMPLTSDAKLQAGINLTSNANALNMQNLVAEQIATKNASIDQYNNQLQNQMAQARATMANQNALQAYQRDALINANEQANIRSNWDSINGKILELIYKRDQKKEKENAINEQKQAIIDTSNYNQQKQQILNDYINQMKLKYPAKYTEGVLPTLTDLLNDADLGVRYSEEIAALNDKLMQNKLDSQLQTIQALRLGGRINSYGSGNKMTFEEKKELEILKAENKNKLEHYKQFHKNAENREKNRINTLKAFDKSTKDYLKALLK